MRLERAYWKRSQKAADRLIGKRTGVLPARARQRTPSHWCGPRAPWTDTPIGNCELERGPLRGLRKRIEACSNGRVGFRPLYRFNQTYRRHDARDAAVQRRCGGMSRHPTHRSRIFGAGAAHGHPWLGSMTSLLSQHRRSRSPAFHIAQLKCLPHLRRA
jgi:hypothetical protein